MTKVSDKLSGSKEIKTELIEYRQSKPIQLGLFEVDEQNEEKYTNTIELYDLIPKYYFGGVIRKMDQYLDILERNFKSRGQNYKLSITPAALIDRKSGKTIHYYPSQREELLEDALRRLAAAKKKGIYLDNDAGVKFTLYELQQELQKMGHGYNINEIKESIEVCNNSILKITTTDGNEVSITSAIFPFVAIETSDDIKNGKNKVVVMFHPLVTKSIDKNTYRLINYPKLMGYKKTLSRYMHKRISHHFTQAEDIKQYTIKMTNLVRDSGMKVYERNSDMLKQIITCLDEMKEANTLSKYKIEKDIKGRKILDATLSLTISDEFIAEIIKANKLKNDVLEFMGSEEFAAKIAHVEKELKDPIYELTNGVILNILGKIKTKEDFKTLDNALLAAKENIKSKPDWSAAAITKAAIREGWTPAKNDKDKVIKEESKLISAEEIEKKEKERRKKIELHRILQQDGIWLKIIEKLKNEFSGDWDKWLCGLELTFRSEEEIILASESKFVRDWVIREFLESKHGNNIKIIIQQIIPSIQRVGVIYLEKD